MPNEITEEEAIPSVYKQKSILYDQRICLKHLYESISSKHFYEIICIKAFVSMFPQTTFLKFPPGGNYAPAPFMKVI